MISSGGGEARAQSSLRTVPWLPHPFQTPPGREHSGPLWTTLLLLPASLDLCPSQRLTLSWEYQAGSL